MMTEEMLKSIRQQATDASMTGTSFPQGADDVTTLVLVAEIERQREEIAALRSVINDIERAVINETVNPPKLQSWIVHRIHALTPEPAPEIKVGDKVRITAGTYEGLECRVTVVGILTATLITPDGKYMPIHVSRLEVIDG